MNAKPTKLFSRSFQLPIFFQSREVFQRVGETDEWERVDEHCTPTLQEQADEWFRETRNLLQSASPPHVDVIYLDDAKQVKCYLSSVTLCYIPAVEGAADAQRNEQSPTTRPAISPPPVKAP